MAAVVAVVTAPTAAAQEAACTVVLYEDFNLQGTSKALGSGSYPQAYDLSPVQNDQVSSIAVTGSENCRVWLFQDADYKGWSQSLTPGTYNLPYGNAMDNDATSMRVLPQATLWISGASGGNAGASINGMWQTHEYFNGFPS